MKKPYAPDPAEKKPFEFWSSLAYPPIKGGWTSADRNALANSTLRDFINAYWLPAIELRLEPTSFVSTRGQWRKHILPVLGDYKLCDLKRETVKDFYAYLARNRVGRIRPLATSSIIRVHAAAHRAFESLVDAEIIPTNPARGAQPRPRKSEQFEPLIWTPHELATFLRHVEGDRLFAMWHVLALTGLRRGEVAALRWQDINFRAATLAVRRAFAIAERRQYLTAPKPAQSRVIELDRGTIRVLDLHRKKLDRERANRGLSRAALQSYVFPDRNGKPVGLNNVTRWFAVLVRQTDLPQIRLHDLRHTHASHLIESGASIKAVQERLGHSNVLITLNLYSHVLPTTQKHAVVKLAEFYATP